MVLLRGKADTQDLEDLLAGLKTVSELGRKVTVQIEPVGISHDSIPIVRAVRIHSVFGVHYQ